MSDSDDDVPTSLSEHDQLKRLGKYVIQRKLGAGGMGTVFLALDEDLNRSVALKVLPRDRAENPILVRRFKSEAQNVAQLHHRNIVGVYEAGTADGLLYIALEYVDGADALELLRSRGVIPVKRSIEIVRGVAQALQHAYEKNIVHRDIKPSNVMIAKDGEIKLADMGLARSIDADVDSSITRAGTTVGTVDYMAPEQARNSKAADIRSDLYSLGCTWYHLIAGQPPFGDGDMVAKVHAHAVKPPPDPRRINERIPEAIVAVIQRLMSKKPQERYQTPDELIADLANPNLHRQGVTSDILASLGKSHVEEMEEDEAEAASVSSSKSKAVKNKSAPEKSKTRTKPSGGGAAVVQAIDEDDDPAEKKANRKKTSGDRALPDRMDAKPVDAGGSQVSIDPVFFQIGLVVLLIGSVIGAIVWAMKTYKSSDIDDAGSLAGIVARNEALNSQPKVDTPHVAPTALPPMPPPEVSTVRPTAEVRMTGPQDDSPFPGVEEFVAAQKSIFPAWTPYVRGPAPDDIPVVQIRRFRTAAGELPSVVNLGQRAKVVLEFQDEGPHRIPASLLGGVKWLGLRGKDVRPTVIVVGTPDAGKSVFGSNRGTIKIEGLDLFWNAPTDAEGAVFGLQGGELLVRNTTLTVSGGKARMVSLRGLPGILTRAVFENVAFRNDAGSGFHFEGPAVEVVGGNVLSLSPGIALDFGTADRGLPPQTSGENVVRFFNSTFVTNTTFLAARHEGPKPPAPVNVRLDRCVAIRHGEVVGNAPAIRLANWPDSGPDASEDPRPAGIKLTGDAFRLLGWNVLTEPSDGAAVTDAAGWRLYWKQSPPSETFQASAPGTTSALHPPYSSESHESLTAALSIPDKDPADQPLGALYSKLPRPLEGLAEHVAAFAGRPTIAPVNATGQEVRFDLKKPQTFNRFLSSEVPDGARVIAFGAGIKFLEPISLKRKSLTIVFEQSDGAPLEIQPQSKSGNEKTAPEAWITLEDGARLELQNGRFEVLYSKGKTHPKRFVQTHGGTLILTRCTVEGTQVADAPLLPLIQTMGGEGSQVLVRGSILTGQGPLLEMAAPQAVVRLEDSLLITAGDAVNLTGTIDRGSLDLHATTLCAGGAVVHVLPDQVGHVRLFSSESLFVPPTAGAASIVLDEARAIGSRLTWWGRANAYSSKFGNFAVTDGHPAGSQEFERDWLDLWGQGHDVRPATGLEAVVLANPLGKLTDYKPGDFALNPNSLAAGWSEEGAAVGADMDAVGAPTAAKTAASQTTPKTNPATPPKKPGSGF